MNKYNSIRYTSNFKMNKRKICMEGVVWIIKNKQLLSTATECSDSMGQGLNTFILLDNSTNMAGEGLEQAKEFIENFLQGTKSRLFSF